MTVEQAIELIPYTDSPIRDEWVSVVEEVCWHSQGKFPYKLVEEWRINEDANDTARRKQLFQPVTKQIYQDGLRGAKSKILNSDYQLGELPESFVDYVLEKTFVIGTDEYDFYNFITDYLYDRSIEDPNGAVIFYPRQLDKLEDMYVDGEWVDVNSSPEPLDIDIAFVPSSKIVDIEDYFAFEKGMFTFVQDDREYAEPYYLLFTDFEIIAIYPVGKKDREVIYNYVSLYEHQIGFMPHIPPMGIITSFEGQHYKRSIMDSFLPHANDALLLYSDYKLNLVKSNYSTEIRREIKCSKCSGTGVIPDHRLVNKTGQEHTRPCTGCNGEGKIAEQNPTGVIIVPQPKGLEQDPIDPRAFSSWIERPLEPIRLTHEKYMEAYDAAQNSILPPKAKTEAESGESLRRQRERYENWVTMMGRAYFHILQNSVNIIDAYYEPFNQQPIEIIEPEHYDLKTIDEKASEVSDYKTKGVSFIAMDRYDDLIRSEYGDDPIKIKAAKAQMLFDRLMFVEESTIVMKKAAGIFTLAECRKHELASSIISQLSRRPEFESWTVDEVVIQAQIVYDSLPTDQTLVI